MSYGLSRRITAMLAIAGLAFFLLAAGTCELLASTDRDGPAFKDIAYGSDARNRMDIYKPPGAGPFPAIIYVHGGGWWNGDKQYLAANARDYMLSRALRSLRSTIAIWSRQNATGYSRPCLPRLRIPNRPTDIS
ncbi:hypothetical protein AJ87_38395 [Rhizobium yanglingense]|nr:hypothetical protein AJ87_38395 [Rhizobium yanglingense]